MDTQRERVRRWTDGYPVSVDGVSDSRGRAPQHTFFYPIECYQAAHIEQLAGLCRAGLGDLEVHLHHEDDSADNLRTVLLQATETLHQRHGLLRKNAGGQISYGFVHGNWALDNSHPDGRHCGVNSELTVLSETGCYADFTMPAAPSLEQTRTINSIYYAIDDPQLPKSHDSGVMSSRQKECPSQGLLMIQGPLLVCQKRLLSKPRLENGNISGTQPPSISRFDDWLRARVNVRGSEDWLFVKLHTHGAQEKNAAVLLGTAMREFHREVKATAEVRGFRYYYVTAWEMAQLVKQAERGLNAPEFEGLSSNSSG